MDFLNGWNDTNLWIVLRVIKIQRDEMMDSNL